MPKKTVTLPQAAVTNMSEVAMNHVSEVLSGNFSSLPEEVSKPEKVVVLPDAAIEHMSEVAKAHLPEWLAGNFDDVVPMPEHSTGLGSATNHVPDDHWLLG